MTMNHKELLRLHLSLLLVGNGRQEVLRALAELLSCDEGALLERLKEVDKQAGADSKASPRRPVAWSMSELLAKHPAKAALLESVKLRFDNRTFLPELKDVRRFLERNGIATKSLKSRTDALPKVMKTIATYPAGELEAIASRPAEQEYSSLGVISDEILKRK